MIFTMENSIIYRILNMTAWRMEAPQLFSGFHIAASLLMIAAAAAAAVYFARQISRNSSDAQTGLTKILAAAGWILVLLEVYKQLFLFFIVNDRVYDWWFFPFQLCSVPMYLCILLPLTGGRLRNAFLTFMGGYAFIGAAATLVYPEDILRTYTALTIHGFLWHGILLFISLLILISGAADASLRGLLRAALLFALLSAAAVCINAAVEPLMQSIQAAHPEVAHSWAAMFYMNPYHISPQPIVNSVQKTAGIPAGLILYALVIAAVSSLVCILTDCMLSGRAQRSRRPRT